MQHNNLSKNTLNVTKFVTKIFLVTFSLCDKKYFISFQQECQIEKRTLEHSALRPACVLFCVHILIPRRYSLVTPKWLARSASSSIEGSALSVSHFMSFDGRVPICSAVSCMLSPFFFRKLRSRRARAESFTFMVSSSLIFMLISSSPYIIAHRDTFSITVCLLFGAVEKNRTSNLLITSQLLCLLSYDGIGTSANGTDDARGAPPTHGRRV